MLSPKEHARLIDQLEYISRSSITKDKQTYQREIKKKLKEHEYASRFAPFEPSYSDLIFINRTTSTDTLNRVIDLVNSSSWFTLDTESANVLYQPNIPCLVQLQIIQSEDISIILIFEFSHFPRRNQHQFQLIQNLFNVLLQPTKIIFTWGDLDELEQFTQYGLFTSAQLDLPQQLNVQKRFRTYWSDMYPHQLPSPNDTPHCSCLDCFGITHNNLIALQDAVAITLHRWIDKRLTRHPFDIGLDPQLRRLNDKELQYRQSMSNYAAYDCDAVKQIIIYTDIINEIQLPIESEQLTVSNNEVSPRNSPMNIFVALSGELSIERSPPRNEIPEPTIDYELEQISDDDDNMIISSQSTSNRIVTLTEPTEHQQTTGLTLAQRKQIHNRSCTLRQRRRLYEYKITCHDIDSRFAIRKIKQMLDEKNIPWTAVNTVKSQTPGKSTLYIGVESPSIARRHAAFVQTLFDTPNYNRIYRRNYNYPANHRYR